MAVIIEENLKLVKYACPKCENTNYYIIRDTPNSKSKQKCRICNTVLC